MLTDGSSTRPFQLRDSSSFLALAFVVTVASGLHSDSNNIYAIADVLKMNALLGSSCILSLNQHLRPSICLSSSRVNFACRGLMPVGLSQALHDKAWADWTEDWQRAGFPDDLSADICDSVHDAMNGAIPHGIDDGAQADALAFQWSTLIDGFDDPQDPLRGMHAIWAFGLWGRTCMYDEISKIEGPDVQMSVEQQYLSMLDDLPISSLLDRLERLHRATPFFAKQDTIQITSPLKKKQVGMKEPFQAIYHTIDNALQPFIGGRVLEWPQQRGIPVCRRDDGSLVMYIVHLFSGRRRQGDCHDWVAKLCKEYFDDIDVIILSIDTAVGGDKCDLLQGEGLASLKRFVALGLATASLSGPPCETWSAARHLPPPAGSRRRWPRPLRSEAQPWELKPLSYKELNQLSTGSALMTSNVSIEVEIVLNDGASVMEHPAPHSNPDYASVWRTALQRLICGGAPGFQLLEVEQWRYGASPVKPTTLRLMGLPPSAEILHDLACRG